MDKLRISGRFRYVKKVGITFDQDDPRSVSRTHQSFAKDADINNVMVKYGRTGLLVDPSIVSNRKATFGDFMDVSFQSMQDRILVMNGAFASLPSDMRARFGNDASRLIDFISDPVNKDEAVALGLLKADPVPAPVVQPAVAPQASEPPAVEPAKVETPSVDVVPPGGNV